MDTDPTWLKQEAKECWSACQIYTTARRRGASPWPVNLDRSLTSKVKDMKESKEFGERVFKPVNVNEDHTASQEMLHF